MKNILLVSGHLCTGKTELAVELERDYGYQVLSTSEVLKTRAQEAGKPLDRLSLQRMGDELDAETKHQWVLDAVKALESRLDNDCAVVVDNIRNREQLEHFRKQHQWNVVHVHLYGSEAELAKRYASRVAASGATEPISYADADHTRDDEDISKFKEDADIRIFTDRTDARDNLVRVAAKLNLYSPPDVRLVDVVVGGQYGSEGKGHVSAYLAHEYDVLVRVGGPNAGHSVSSPSGVYVYHQLPSGTKDSAAKILLGPGMTIYVPTLLKEIHECGVSPDRLFIDPQAMIIEESDLNNEKPLVGAIASTGRGGGSASARRISERGKPSVRLAREIADLKPYVGDAFPYRGSTTRQLEIAYRRRESILLEGTQGSGLSILHGSYPHVTSRETNVAGCLAEAGISPSRVRKVLLVVRTTPIRVANPDGGQSTSGPLKHETTFDEVAAKAFLDAQVLHGNEKTSTTKRKRRVGWFDWEQFRNACSVNAPTDIVLTFADYIHKDNRNARRFEQLTQNTIKFIEEIERVAQAPVSLINTRFPRDEELLDLRTVIDRRNWRGRLASNPST